jgi:hypothetical protein
MSCYFSNQLSSFTPLHSPYIAITFLVVSHEIYVPISFFLNNMAIPLSLSVLLLILAPSFISCLPVQDPELVVEEVHR